MKNRLIIAGIAVAVLIGSSLLLIPRKDPASVAPAVAEPYQKADDPSLIMFGKAKKFEEKGDLLSAKKIYKKILTKFPDSGIVKNVRERLYSVNMGILFSPIPNEDSVFYEVKPGDTLTKIAREFGTTVELIIKSNNLSNTVIRPMTRLKVSTAKYSILVDKSQNMLMLKSDEEVLKTYTVSTGADNATPTGTYKIRNKLIDPTWYRAGAIVPPESPENILGTRWMGFDLDSYGIHGTTDESTIGMHITKGCVRMRNSEIEELYAIIPVGVEVKIID
ncbi:MAG: L,D-transpeptidase family protein [Candidatus Omnitrophica bacterium]|nr:L,D-transpeptidase family protein [Candidatus Omnitrophota bacterium]